MCKFILLFLTLVVIQVHGQTLPIEGLFEYESIFQKKYVRISERVNEEWDLSDSLIQIIYYNAHKDKSIESVQSITQVLSIHRLPNYQFDITELLDDGNHYDCDANDGIYGNIYIGEYRPSEFDEFIIDVRLDTIGINYDILNPPVTELPEISKIIAPTHESDVYSEFVEVSWFVDPNADGFEIILLEDLPSLGQKFTNVIWSKKYTTNPDPIYMEKIPAPLSINNEYTIVVWAYKNLKYVNDKLINGAYSMEISRLFVKTPNTSITSFSSRSFPNPFNSKVFINYTLPRKGRISIKVYNIVGETIITLLNTEQSAGEHVVLWDGKDNSGERVSSGVYIYRIVFNDQSISRKISLIR